MPKTVIVTGYAKMPTGTMIRALVGTLGMGAVVELETHTIVEGWASLYAPQNQAFVAEVIKGQSLLSDESDFIRRVQEEYWGAAQGAICQCFRDMVRRYREQLEMRGLLPAGFSREMRESDPSDPYRGSSPRGA